jgi:dynein heavy chain, axonemal
MISTIAHTFGVDEKIADQFIRERESQDVLEPFFQVDGPKRIMVYYQPQTIGGPKSLFFTDGASDKLVGKGCYFVRMGELDINMDAFCDNSIICGELAPDTLNELHSTLAFMYQPLMNNQKNWGMAEEEHSSDFTGGMARFIAELNDNMKSITKSVELRKPDSSYDYNAKPVGDSTLEHVVDVLESWCNVIDRMLEDDDGKADDGGETGPQSELDFWKRKQQNLMSIIEQLKSKECRNVLAIVQSCVKAANPSSANPARALALLRRWKQVDINLTEAANEAKDNVKYLFTLEKFIEPLYNGTPVSIVDTLPAMMNSIKMIHTIARYYNTNERMTNLFRKITNQMITNCKKHINPSSDLQNMNYIWDMNPLKLVEHLEACLKLNEAYQEQYRVTKDKLQATPKGKQFDFSDQAIFGKFDLFCRRLIKLIDMFSTIHQFRALAAHKLDGMEGLIEEFKKIINSFKTKGHDLLGFDSNKFDRDYVEFNVQISELEGSLQDFINASFDSITDIEQSLNLLKRFQQILQRERLKSDLDSKFNVIFQNYGTELEKVQKLYEKSKHSPPLSRNLPPVAGNITWSRHLLKRIEEPMKKFETNQNVLASKDAKKIIRSYNKVARTLVAFEYLWYQAWTQSIETSKAGLQATLIIRHPDDGNLYVNFDQEILQLIREAKCLDRMGIEIPESAKIVLLQEDKFKSYYNDLHYLLKEYDRIVSRILPVTADLLRPHINDLEYKLRPGMVTLTWTSMNIDAYKHHFHTGLTKLEELVVNMNDVVDNRIEKNLRIISKTQLVDLPRDASFTLEAFVRLQEEHVDALAESLQGKNVEIETAVDDLVEMVQTYKLDPHIEEVTEETVNNIKAHYRKNMYRAMLTSTKTSLNALKKRLKGSGGSGFFFVQRPFFELDVTLAIPTVALSPSLLEVQRAINKASQAVLRVSKRVYDWGQNTVPIESRKTFFDSITKDVEIVCVVLMLTGSIEGTKNAVKNYLETFTKYQWMWKEDKDMAYKKFLSRKPNIDAYEYELKRFVAVEADIAAEPPLHIIGSLTLNTNNLKLQLKHEASMWKVQYSDNLHKQAREKMAGIVEYMKSMMTKVHREVVDLDSLRFVMQVLKEIRERESGIDMEIGPVLDMYTMLEYFLPDGYMDKAEMDQRSVLRASWTKLVDHAEDVQDDLSVAQINFKRQLLQDVKTFTMDCVQFRSDFEENGPMVQGLAPSVAIERLKKYKGTFEILERKRKLYTGGEELFALRKTDYPELTKTSKEINLLDQLYSLYGDVIKTIENWKTILWTAVASNMEQMSEKIDSLEGRCLRMPKKLRDWQAYKDLGQQIGDFKLILPLLQALSHPSVESRHWNDVMKVTGTTFDVTGSEFTLQTLIDADLARHAEDVEEICEAANKQLGIKTKMLEIKNNWATYDFEFQMWKDRGIPVLIKVPPILEELEESQMNCQTMLTARHIAPFKEQVTALLTSLSDTTDNLELWLKVQLMWCALESVFLGGDIAKQLPREAKKFSKLDKEFIKLMQKGQETGNIVQCCANELLRNSLPVMYSELEKCQKSLEGYLEQKRNKFPRFYFVSNPVLLQVLSQGSDPEAMQPFYEKVFDAISSVVHDEQDKSNILSMINSVKGEQERVSFNKPVKAKGNIEDWLNILVAEMRAALKDVCRSCSYAIMDMENPVDEMEDFVNQFPGQFSLLGIQLMWTTDIEDALAEAATKKHAVTDAVKKCTSLLQLMSGWTLDGSMKKLKRVKIETMITIQVHQKDVAQNISSLHKSKKLIDANDFAWLQQARFYWQDDGDEDIVDDNGCQVIKVTDVDFQYQYEYLGCKDRLVITPLTDRCYITLAQALGMCFGGAPAGPAGTGKTETVKDMGRTLGLWVCVTNCTDQQRHTDCAKIFKGLCQGGMWGCFDEFNRIRLPVLSVVAQQVLAIQNAKKGNLKSFSFPGESNPITLNASCGFFITMNPGYAGRQELPENLKVLFRSVAMMVPDREIIMKVKLCSVGYINFPMLSKKFATLYFLSEEQLSKQKHYDFGLRNILSVLRTAGANKRKDGGRNSESYVLYQTLRDMNLSKFVAQDVPLFLSLLADLFPALAAPPDSAYPSVEATMAKCIEKQGLVNFPRWQKKVVQLYETTLVRHGIMLVGPSGGGKTEIFTTLENTLAIEDKITYKESRLNPKAIRAEEMYGEVDRTSGEWTAGVFASMWAKYNNRNNPYITWIIADGPVDAIWIEDLNTVLDDNRILTLANGDRMPMTDNVKIMFENEQLNNASPATVSRAGIIYVSDTDLGWTPIVEAWLKKRPEAHRNTMLSLFKKYIGEESPTTPGDLFLFIGGQCEPVIELTPIGCVAAMLKLLNSLCADAALSESHGAEFQNDLNAELEKLFLYALVWTVCGILEQEGRVKVNEYLCNIDAKNPGPQGKAIPDMGEGETLFEYYVDSNTMLWQKWRPPTWEYPVGDSTDHLDFSNLLVPTMDSVRAQNILSLYHRRKEPCLLIGASGTAKSCTAQMFFDTLDSDKMLIKTVNFSSATLARNCQDAIELSLDKRGGKSFGPPNGMKMTVFLDDLSMPKINDWGDQPTLEIVRQIVETGKFAFLDKDKRGDLKVLEDVQFVAAMNTPGGGKNDIPNRLKRHFGVLILTLPSINSIDDIYGQMLKGRFLPSEFDPNTLEVVEGLTRATISMWKTVKSKLLPTPAKFHYVFNMRDLSRVFQGVLLAPKATINTGGSVKSGQEAAETLLCLWKHESMRVFCDKLTNEKDKKWFQSYLRSHIESSFPSLAERVVDEEFFFVDFLRDDVFDENDQLVESAPKVYEDGGVIDQVRDRVVFYMNKYNEGKPPIRLDLVLFDDAMRHLVRISRIIQMPRGSALLVGVGGSGKQSLTRLAAYIGRHKLFQVALTKQYNLQSLIDDVKELYISAGQYRTPTTFLFTENEIKDEMFLEVLNNILMTGQVPGLFAKDEMIAMTGDLSVAFGKERPDLEPNQLNLNQFFFDCVRDNLHLAICMSPVNPLFPIRARNFPGVINCCTIDWFLPWPEEALVAVSNGLIGEFAVDCTEEIKESLLSHMGFVHTATNMLCTDYFEKSRRSIYQTPKSYLSFLGSYKKMYKAQLEKIKHQEASINLGLEKLVKGAADVEDMKIVLAEEQVKLDKATKDTEKMLGSLQVSSLDAQRESEKVMGIKSKCEADASRIAGEKALCEEDLAKAQPFVDQANDAIASIKPGDIGEVKTLKKPADIIKLVFDVVLILFMEPLLEVKPAVIKAAKKDWDLWGDSFDNAKPVMGRPTFLKELVAFGETGKDLMNEETIELMTPYCEIEFFNPDVAGGASKAARGLCTFCVAMKSYYYASKIVKPKLEALQVAAGQLAAAMKALAEAEARLDACKATLAELQTKFETQMQAKNKIEEGARKLQRKMQQASELINGLAGERIRWTEDAKEFQARKTRLVGDMAICAAFTSYAGGFNQEYRDVLINKTWVSDLKKRGIPVSAHVDPVGFMVDEGIKGDWAQQKLPSDPLSIQNGVLVTNATRYPMMIDPQAQAITWIANLEAERMPSFGIISLNNNRLKENLEFAMCEGMAFMIKDVEETLDPMLDPVLDKAITKKGKTMFITVADQPLEYNPDFQMYFITRLPNPHFSPELQAKTTVIDFTVTMKGLEEQLLGHVIGKEQQALEEQLNEVLATVTNNTKALLLLDAQLLDRLTSNKGNLLDDEELIGVLANTKAKAAEVKIKLKEASETKENIGQKREIYRDVATRGSILYFAIVEMSLVNAMYQTSLFQFLAIFMDSMNKAERANLASKRVVNIIETMTYMVYRYINRGLYEVDKLTFILLTLMKILSTAGLLTPEDVGLLLRGGAALDINGVRKNPMLWMPSDVWLNILKLSGDIAYFRTLPDTIIRNEAMWKRWYEENEPESTPVPDLEAELTGDPRLGHWRRLLLIRCLRMDRTTLAAKTFIQNTEQMGERYIEPVVDTVESVADDMTATIPVIYLLSVGADPTEMIENLARKNKQTVAVISMGEGQEPFALAALRQAAEAGSWVLLQNCELGLDTMDKMEGLLKKTYEGINPDFRLYFTAAPNEAFPLGLLQMAIKVTNEPPAGLRAGLSRSYTVMIDQDRLERIESPLWRQLLFGLCFLHSIVQERRKFGALGWCIPYEYNAGDLGACISFLERHLYAGSISWPTLQYMVSEAQYGGKITDDLDKRLFKTYAMNWLNPGVLDSSFTFNPESPINPIPDNFEYTVPDLNEVAKYKSFCTTMPRIDTPEVFGLHPNADLTFRVKEALAMMKTLTDTQPKQGGGGGGQSRESVVNDKCVELLSKFPKDYQEIEYKQQIQKQGGLGIPLNICLFQEVERLQVVIAKIRAELESLRLAIKGEVVMTPQLQSALDSIFDAKVPSHWTLTPGGDEFSWLSPSLGLWFPILLGRDEQLSMWLSKGRPPCFWMTGFFNPQGFLTAMKQEVTRAHRSEQWALDDMTYTTNVTEHESSQGVKKGPDEGVYVHGLYIDGAAWKISKNKENRALCDSEPKILFCPLPVMHVSAIIKSKKPKDSVYGPNGAYKCPVYKYPRRTGLYYIFMADLPAGKETKSYWTLRGTALLCSTD